jgi:excisionase family DNA binding protein
MYHPLLEKEVHTPPDAARILRVNPVTVVDWIKTGKLKAYKIGGRFFIASDDVGRKIDEMTTPWVPEKM